MKRKRKNKTKYFKRILAKSNILCCKCNNNSARYKDITNNILICNSDQCFITPYNINNRGYKNRRSWYHNYYLQSIHWKYLRKRALEYYNYKCIYCDSTDDLEIHHIDGNYNTLGREIISKDIEVVCRLCHQKIHNITYNSSYNNSTDKEKERCLYKEINKSKVNSLLDKYNKLRSKPRKIKIRNEIFKLIYNYLNFLVIIRYNRIEEIYQNKIVFSQEDIPNLCWDCFLYFLNNYKIKYSLKKSLKNNVFWCMSNIYNARLQKKYIHIDQSISYSDEDFITKDLYNYHNNYINLLNSIIVINQIRSILPDEHKIIWDDALMSLSPSPKERYITYNNGLTQNTYFNLKRSFINIIKFLKIQ